MRKTFIFSFHRRLRGDPKIRQVVTRQAISQGNSVYPSAPTAHGGGNLGPILLGDRGQEQRTELKDSPPGWQVSAHTLDAVSWGRHRAVKEDLQCVLEVLNLSLGGRRKGVQQLGGTSAQLGKETWVCVEGGRQDCQGQSV